MHTCRTLLSVTIALLAASPRESCAERPGTPNVASIQVAPKSLTGGKTATVTIALNAAAPLSGVDVDLAYTNGGVLASAPRKITVPVGQQTYTFPLTTIATAITTTVGIAATSGTSSAVTSLTVRKPEVITISMPSTIQGGRSFCLSIKLDGAAPAGGLPLSVTWSTTVMQPADVYSSTGSATAPSPAVCAAQSSTPNIAQGSDSVAYGYRSAPVDASQSVAFTASVGTPRGGSTTILPPRVWAAILNSCSSGNITVSSVTGPASLTLVVSTLDDIPPAGVKATVAGINLATPLPASVALTQSRTTTPTNSGGFATGPSTTEYYGCAPIEIPAVTQPTTITVRASYGGISNTRTITNTPINLVSFTVPGPLPLFGSGATVTGTVQLSGPAGKGGVAVALTSSNPAVAPVPSFITVPEGASTTQFTMIVVVPASEPDIATGSIVTATLGATSRTQRVIVAR